LEDWHSAAATLQRMTQLTPTDVDNWLLLIEAAFRSGDVAQGRAASARLLGPNASSARISSVLQLWADFWPSPRRIQDARKNAEQAAGADQKIAYAPCRSTA